MSIRPVDFQVLVPKSPEMSRMQQTETNNPSLQQQHVSQKFEKQVEHNMQQVIQSNKSEKKDVNPDESGNRGEYRKNRNKKKDEKDEKDTPKEKKSEKSSMFDVMI